MNQSTKTLTLVLLALLLSAVRVAAQQNVVIARMLNGKVVADKTSAVEGETVVLTVKPNQGFALKDGSLLVEMLASTDNSDHATLTRAETPEVGALVDVTQKDANTFTFRMPNNAVRVSAQFYAVTNAVYIDEETLVIPSNSFIGQTGISDIYLPDTDELIEIEDGAFDLDHETGENHRVATIHTPLKHLDDYALMSALSEHYREGKIQATVNVPRQYWSFSCGVDVELPEGVKIYIVRSGSSALVEIKEIEEAKVIKANNGVLLACPDNEGHAYEMVVRPSANRPSGTKPATGNARSYEGNLLEPVINDRHYNRGGYYILANNQFHRITQEDAESKIPACKAVLYLPEVIRTRAFSISPNNR